MASVSIRGLCKDKPSALGKGGPHRILHDISMDVADGEFLVLVGTTNAVNLTDGLDGLAAGCMGSVAAAYLALAYVAGNVVFAEYLQVPSISGAHELAVFCGCLLGAALGFLWWNAYPAKVFMGDFTKAYTSTLNTMFFRVW